MSMNDPLGDMLTRIRNAQMRHKSTVRSPASKIRRWVLDVLQSEGYIRGYEEVTEDGHPELEIALKYYDGQPVIRSIQRVSKPGRRVYASVDAMPRVASQAAARPSPTADPLSHAPWPRTMRRRSAGEAPSAARTPSSRVREATENAITPNVPTAASRSAVTANTPTSRVLNRRGAMAVASSLS